MPATLADSADPWRLYELAVQAPAFEADLLAECFRTLRGRPARALREDFCGSAALCREWVRRDATHTALGIDIDPAVLAIARTAADANLPADAARRLTLHQADLSTGPDLTAGAGLDLAVAFNFSYWLLAERATLRAYLTRLRGALAADGVLFLDAFGGSDAARVLTERRAVDDGGAGFTYVWEQAAFDPVSGRQRCAIHFEFPDGSRLAPAFSYTWRLWTLPELQEVLLEAGYARVTVYWQGWDADGAPDGRFRPTRTGSPDAGWICYLAAEV